MNKLFSDDDINWFKNINIKENKNYSYGIEIKFININKNAYFNILDNFKNVISKNSEFYNFKQ